MTTLAAALLDATARLRTAGIESPRREATLLLQLASGLDRTTVLARDELALTADQAARFAELVERRTVREPFAYLAGRREFYGRDFLVGPGVLIPRPETETLITVALERRPERTRSLRILDLGVGSGAILLTLLAEYPAATGTGIDASPAALAWATRNADALGLADRVVLHEGRWGEGLTGTYDLIVSNPPYVAQDELPALEPELSHEPAMALTDGGDGLGAYRAMTPDLRRLLAADGLVLLEIGAGQAGELADWFGRNGFEVHDRADLAGHARCLVLTPAAGGD